MEKIVDFKLKFRKGDIFSTKLIFKFDQLVFELNPQLTLVVKIMF